MSINHTEALVIGSTNLVEADRIISVYTPTFGQIRGVAHGVKRIKNRFGSSLEPLTHIHLIFKERANRELQLFQQADIINYYPGLREDILRLTAGLYMAELVQKMTPVGGNAQPDIFSLLLRSLDFLSTTKDIIAIIRIFEVRLLDILGYRPHLEQCVDCKTIPHGYGWSYSSSMGGLICPKCRFKFQDTLPLSPGAIKFLIQAMQIDLDKLDRLKILPSCKVELENVLQSSFLQHINTPFKSYPILKKLILGKNSLTFCF